MALNADPTTPDNRLVSYRFFRRFADFLRYIDHHITSNHTLETFVALFKDLAQKCGESAWGATSPHVDDYDLPRRLRRRCLCGDGRAQIEPYLRPLVVMWTWAEVVLLKQWRIGPGILRGVLLQRLEGNGELSRQEEMAKRFLIRSHRGCMSATKTVINDALLDTVLHDEAQRIQSTRASRDQQKEDWYSIYGLFFGASKNKKKRKKRPATDFEEDLAAAVLIQNLLSISPRSNASLCQASCTASFENSVYPHKMALRAVIFRYRPEDSVMGSSSPTADQQKPCHSTQAKKRSLRIIKSYHTATSDAMQTS